MSDLEEKQRLPSALGSGLRPAALSPSTADAMQRQPMASASSLASRPQSQSAGVWELRMVGCAPDAGPGSCGLGPMQTLQTSWCVFLPLRELGMDFSQRLSGDGEVDHRHSPPGNAPCYLRRRRVTMMDSFCRDRPPRPRLEPEGQSGRPECPVKGDRHSRGSLPFQLGHPRTGTKADTPVYVDSLASPPVEASPPGKSPRVLAM